jgi:polysaccharide biosynthesis/export protein
MRAPHRKPQTLRITELSLGSIRLFALVLAIGIVLLVTMDFGAKASDEAGQGHQVSSKADEPERGSADAGASSAKLAPEIPGEASGDYHLSPGDRLKLVVLDQPQLSGEFIIDGGGSILLPLAGGVSLSGLTLAEAQKVIQDRFADGVLVQPAVSLRITKFKPIFVTGSVRKPGSYSFILGESAKAAIATAGGEGEPVERSENVALADFVAAQERVRQLEADHVILLMRKARLEAQRDERDNFMMPLLVGLNTDNVDFQRVYSAENDAFLRLSQTYHDQLDTLQKQRPRIEAEIKAVTEQIASQNARLDIVNGRLADLEPLFNKGFLRKEVLTNQQIEKTVVQSQIATMQGQVAHLRQIMGDLDVKLLEVKSTYFRQIFGDLQDASQRLRVVETSMGPARRILALKAEAASGNADDREYTILVSRARGGRTVTFAATDDTTLSPGDVVDVKLKQRDYGGDAGDGSSTSTQAERSVEPASSSVAESGDPGSH